MDNKGDENYHIYTIHIDDKKEMDLTPFKNIQASILNELKYQKKYIIISMNKDDKRVFEPYKVNIYTGEMQKLFENKDISKPIEGYIFDKDGNLRGYSRLIDGISHIYYKNLKTNTFKLIQRLKTTDTFNILEFNYMSKNPNVAYVASNIESDKINIYLYDLEKNKMIKELFSNKQYDASDFILSRKRNYELDAFEFIGEKYQIVPVSNYYKKLHKRLLKEFGDQEFHVVDITDDENMYLIFLTGDKIYGKY